MITVVESGSGKNNLLLYSIFFNYGVRTNEDSNIDNIEEVATIFTELKEVMYNRYKEMQLNYPSLKGEDS